MVRPISFAAVGAFLLAGCATGRLAFDQGVESARPASGAQESHMPVVVLASNSGALPLIADTSSAHATAIVQEGEAMQSLSADVADIRDRRTQLERDLALLENAEAPKTAEVVTPGAVPALADAERATIERRVHFLTASAKLTPAAKASLIEKAAILSIHPDRAVEIIGHSDARGNVDFNQRLSEQRAEAARQFLVQKGVQAERLSASGRGIHEPAVEGSGAQVWRENRRVEFHTP